MKQQLTKTTDQLETEANIKQKKNNYIQLKIIQFDDNFPICQISQSEKINKNGKNSSQKIRKRKKNLSKPPSILNEPPKQNRKSQNFNNIPNSLINSMKIINNKRSTQLLTLNPKNQNPLKICTRTNTPTNYLKKYKQQQHSPSLKNKINNLTNPKFNTFSRQKQKFQLDGINLQNQNILQLHSFIRGAYDNDLTQYSDVINLTMIDKFRKQFYIFSKLYDQVVQTNHINKFGLRDIKQTNLKDIVFLNQQKKYMNSPEFMGILEKLKIMK